ncbi:esterase-like activity of phytase family protein [Pseudomonas sp.]|uniref:esterase-like activity of phytase family protein n=1 Tax=Pseudomonas sp. TaxID=306 RepID=UPI003BB6A433
MKAGASLGLLLGWLLLVATASSAEHPSSPLTELTLVAEQAVDGMPSGNLSGLAWCGGALWALSDRDDDRLYRLSSVQGVWQARAEVFVAPPVPASGLSWGQRVRNDVSGLLRGGDLDFEGLSCDAAGNRYLVSEAHVAVLKIPPQGPASWLSLPPSLLRQARASGLLWQFNGLFEGVAVDPAGQRLWLAAERQNRGLLALYQESSRWGCQGSCVLLSEAGELAAPASIGGEMQPNDFADLVFFNEKLFSLERLAHQICRRNPQDGSVERCWSFAAEALTEARRYDQPYGLAEALWIDADGAWLGLDNGASSSSSGQARGDGEARPIVWRFAAPAGGWDAAS